MTGEEIRNCFPYFKSNKKSIYFDSAATTHKPQSVIDTIISFYQKYNSNIHRSMNKAATIATQKFENSRSLVKELLNAEHSSEIVFTNGATDSINLVAQSFLKKQIKKNDIILISETEHHSNLVPWQQLALETGAKIDFLPIRADLLVDTDKIKAKINDKVKLISTHHISSISGGKQNIEKIIKIAKSLNIPILIDGAQAIAHTPIDVKELDCDFYCFSGHKLFGPTGTGILYSKSRHLDGFIPYKFGGGMVDNVSLHENSFSEFPHRLEAGTPNISGVIGLGEAVNFVKSVGFSVIQEIETSLAEKFNHELSKVDNCVLVGSGPRSAPIFTFNIEGIHHYDLASLLSEYNICTRSGHLCSQPMIEMCGLSGAVRASLSIYNNEEEIENFMVILKKAISFLKR